MPLSKLVPTQDPVPQIAIRAPRNVLRRFQNASMQASMRPEVTWWPRLCGSDSMNSGTGASITTDRRPKRGVCSRWEWLVTPSRLGICQLERRGKCPSEQLRPGRAPELSRMISSRGPGVRMTSESDGNKLCCYRGICPCHENSPVIEDPNKVREFGGSRCWPGLSYPKSSPK